MGKIGWRWQRAPRDSKDEADILTIGRRVRGKLHIFPKSNRFNEFIDAQITSAGRTAPHAWENCCENRAQEFTARTVPLDNNYRYRDKALELFFQPTEDVAGSEKKNTKSRF